MNRRKFLLAGSGALAASAIGITGYSIGIEPEWLEIVQRDLPVALLPRSLHGATLALVSDIHVGPRVSDDYLIHSLRRLSLLTPDIVVVTGDFITHDSSRGEHQFAQLGNVLGHMPHGRLATIGVLGNHDYGSGWNDPVVAHRVVAEAERAGVSMLRNDVHSVEGLDVVGIDDLWSGLADTRRAFAARRNDSAIVLCHNPDALDELQWADYTGWILSGHTHGGQCKPPFLPPPVLPVKNKRYSAGEISVDDRRSLYISRGIGYLIQVRFNVRPEITLFTLRAAIPRKSSTT